MTPEYWLWVMAVFAGLALGAARALWKIHRREHGD